MRQLFTTGEVVNIARDSLSGPPTGREFRVVRRYPIAERPAMYHVSSRFDRDERMVPEGELSVAMPALFGHADGRGGKIVRLFPDIVHLRPRLQS
jgi:hypothetical protein